MIPRSFIRSAQLFYLCTLGLGVAWLPVCGQTAGTLPDAWLELSENHFSNWQGVKAISETEAELVSAVAAFRYPDGVRGQYKHGFRLENDGTQDWRDFCGVQFDIWLPSAGVTEIQVQIAAAGISTLTDNTKANVGIEGKGWHRIFLPWSAFDFVQARYSFLKYAKELRITPVGTTFPGMRIKDVRIVRGDGVALSSPIRGKSAAPGDTVSYEVRVLNCENKNQTVSLLLVKRGWEGLAATVEPKVLMIPAGESRSAVVTVRISSQIPTGAHETQELLAIGDGARNARLTFITARALPHPNILHTADRWQEVRDKVKQYPWAKTQQDKVVQQAAAWNVPEIATPPKNDPDDTMGPFLFVTANEHDLMACGVAWQLTRQKNYAEKAALFLRRLSDPQNGYPKTLRGCNQSLVQEGHFFQHAAMTYDMILDSGVLSIADKKQIEGTFRLFIDTIEYEAGKGAINNWNLSELCGAFYCALAIQDLTTADRFFAGPSGIRDQLAKGTMDDGWWYECSISYNVWCAREFSQVALAYEPWGVNFKDERVPANLSESISIKAELSGGAAVSLNDEGRGRPFGMSLELGGPNRRSYRSITDLWNSLLSFLDYRGVMFGVNDSTENLVVQDSKDVAGQSFEVAYYLYRDPAYASIIKRGSGSRDLLYGVPELPQQTPELFKVSAYADNVGVVMLRSQTEDRPIREQIQAVLHYGMHGWAHGHYDRTNLLSLMRYGRSFYNPEMIWYGYEPYMYKFYVQTSVSKNMVTVDQKMQESDPGDRLLFYSGKMMQATAVQNKSRWSNPPYGGMVYDYVPVKTFAEKMWREGRSVPTPIQPPAYGTLTDFTKPVLQRRAMVVTDDYVLLADYVKGTQKHAYDSLLQMKGFLGLDAAKKAFLRHDAQWSSNPLGSAQFVTDCDWYSVEAPAVARFEMKFGPHADNAGTRTVANEDGVLKLDVHTLWPKTQEIMVGTAPEAHEVQKRLFYSVRGDGKTLAEGKFGAWILGQGDIDVPLDGIKELVLETRVEISKKPTVFWGDARLVTRDGKEVSLQSLSVKYENVLMPKMSGRDYFGGPVKIVGNEYKQSIPGQPQDEQKVAIVRVDLSGLNAVRFKATLGSDYPLGDERQRRKTYAVHTEGTEARFLTVIEPYESSSQIASAVALSEDKVRVQLKDGRTQEITINNLVGDGKGIVVSIEESKAGKLVRSEKSILAGK